MATRKIKGLAIVTGSYKDPKTGVDKNRYKTIGHILQKDDGGKFMLIDPFVNLAAAPLGQGKDMVMVSMFEIDETGQGTSHGQQAPMKTQAPAQQPPAHNGGQPYPMVQNGQYIWSDGHPMAPHEVQQYQQHLAQQNQTQR
ncbi:MAG: hypothetical protein JXR47_05300 [Thiotrichales bacterium]|nr:hypothetical protein [Thiotrichales bacterium]